MNYYVWVGPRDIDCYKDPMFSDKICYCSESNSQKVRKANIYGNEFINFISDRMTDILVKHTNAKFIFYNPKIAYQLNTTLRKHIICLNDSNLLNILSDKIYIRYWLSHYVPVLPSIIVDSPNLSFQELRTNLGYAEEYVVQQSKSSGGFGTYIVSDDNGVILFLKKEYRDLFIASPYKKGGVPVNVNAFLGQKQTIIFAPSIQVTQINNHRILYHGADYIAAQSLSVDILDKLRRYTLIVLNAIKQLGYKGIVGLDFLITKNEIFFLEINPRYQASSFLINIALIEEGYPSLSQINLNVFQNISVNKNIEKIHVDYSFYKYIHHKDYKHTQYAYLQAKCCPYVYDIITDGWKIDMVTEEDAYCYSLIFSTNICSVIPNLQYNIYSNIHGEEEYLKYNINSDIGLKIALLNQGCIISQQVRTYLQTKGVLKKAVFSSIDFRLNNGLPINAPIDLKFVEFSPFSIQYNGNIELFYYNTKISNLSIETEPNWLHKDTTNGIPFRRIAYLSTDRLRLKHESVCVFKKMGKGCFFCNIPSKSVTFTQADFKEVLDFLLYKPTFRHILIGGGSEDPAIESQNITYLAQEIRKRNKEIPIYLMSLPPSDLATLYLYEKAGINEVAFNIEIWDRSIAGKLMPGKAEIPLEKYIEVLKASTNIWGKTGNVRTALIVGLNQESELIKAIQYLCSLGIQPMLSVFRPMPGTKLENVVPPSNKVLLSIYRKANNICKSYHLELGPSCKECRNNMLAL